VNCWPVEPLGALGTWLSGGTPFKGNPSYWGGDIPWISAKSLHDFRVRVSDDRVTALGATHGTRVLPVGGLLFLVRGMSLKTEFRLGIAQREVTFNQDVKGLVPRQGVLPEFLAYAVKARTEEVLDMVEEAGHGTGVLPTDRLQSLEIAVPLPDEQRAIAEMLGALDDQIELNREMNRTLEEMAYALFKSWFVDFDPVVAKAEGRTPFGLDAATAALFPSTFSTDPTWGDIPARWSTKALDEVADFRNGLALQSFRPGVGEARLPVVKIASLRTGRADSGEWSTADIETSCILDDGDIVFSWSGSLVVVVWCGGKGALNQHLFKVTSATYPKWFFQRWTMFHLPEFQAIAADKATTMGHIRRFHLTDARCVIAPQEVIKAADRQLSPWLDLLIQNELKSRTLATLRDALLPKLLSGEIRLKQADKTIEAAL